MNIESPQTETTWKDVVADALRELGGEAHTTQIAEIAKKHPKAVTNSRVDEKVRQVVRAYSIFESIEEGSGEYRLLEDNLELSAVGAPTTKEITDEIQGKLLYIGRANGFETHAPADDQTKRVFDGKPLRELVTLQSGLETVARLREEEKKIVRLIDVLWFREERGELIPHCAFEVEHSTNVLDGLQRLDTIHPLWRTQLFIIGRDEPKKARFDALMKSPTWKNQATRFVFRFFNDVTTVYDCATAYQKARSANEQAMQNFFG